MPTERRPDGALVVVTGATRSGKTAWTMQALAGAARALVWDPEGQWALTGRCRRIAGRAELVARAAAADPARLAYVPPAINAAEFGFFCRVAWLWIQRAPGALVVEELADVTTPGKAPDEWGLIVRRGLKYGAELYAITQRPAESDKTIMGNATALHVHRMQRAQDRAYMARELDVPEAEIASLAPLEYLHRDALKRKLTRSRVSFAKGARRITTGA